MKNLNEIRARAAQHNDEIESAKWYTVAELAARWQVSETTVRLIPRDQLDYKEFGAGQKLKRRRYRSDWVEAYENESDRTAQTETPAGV